MACKGPVKASMWCMKSWEVRCSSTQMANEAKHHGAQRDRRSGVIAHKGSMKLGAMVHVRLGG